MFGGKRKSLRKSRNTRKGGFMGLFKKKKVNTKKNNKNYNNMNLSGLESEHKKLLNKFNKINNSQKYLVDLSKKSAFNNNNKTASIEKQYNNMKNRVGNDLKKVQKAIAKKKGYAGGKRRKTRKRSRNSKRRRTAKKRRQRGGDLDACMKKCNDAEEERKKKEKKRMERKAREKELMQKTIHMGYPGAIAAHEQRLRDRLDPIAGRRAAIRAMKAEGRKTPGLFGGKRRK